jgi:hypothetical protein
MARLLLYTLETPHSLRASVVAGLSLWNGLARPSHYACLLVDLLFSSRKDS